MKTWTWQKNSLGVYYPTGNYEVGRGPDLREVSAASVEAVREIMREKFPLMAERGHYGEAVAD